MARPIVLRMSVEDADKVRKALEGVGTAGERMLANLEKAAKSAASNDNGLRAVKAGADDLRASVEQLAGRLGPAGAALSAFGLAGAAAGAGLAALGAGAVKVVQASDEMALSFARVKLAVGGVDAARDSMAKLFALSQQGGVAMKDTVDTFVRIQRAAADLGATRTEVAQVVSNIQKLTAASGATGQELSAGMVQLGQALASGRLQGDELRSILENMPPVARAIADEFGVSVGELRKLGSEGQITSDRVFKALLKTTEEANRQFAEMPDTLDKSLTRVGNAWTARLAEIDRVTSASKFFQYLLNGTADFIAPTTNDNDRLAALQKQIDFYEKRGFYGATTGPQSRAALIGEQERLTEDMRLAARRSAALMANDNEAADAKKAENAEKLAQKQTEIAATLIGEAQTRTRLAGLTEDQRRIEEARLKAAEDIKKAGLEEGTVKARLVEEEYIRAAQAENAARATERTNKLIEKSTADAERQRALEEKREVSLERYIEKLEEEARVSGETSAEREISRALLEAQAKLLDDQGRAMRDLTDLEKERISNAIRQKDALEEQRKAAEKFARDLERTITRSTDRAVDFAADSLYDAFTGKITSVGEFLKTTLLRAAAQAMAEMVLRPLIAPIVSAGVQAAVGAGLGSAFGVSGGGAAASGAAAGSGIGLGTVAGAGAVGYGFAAQGSSFWNALGNPFGLRLTQVAPNAVYTVGHSATALTAAEAAQEAVAAGASGTGTASGVLGAVAPYLQIAGGLFSAYNFAKDPTLTNGIAAAGGLYAGTSAFMGLTGLGPALPFAGPIGIAAAAIGLIGSLFGGKKGKPVVHADQTSRDIEFLANGGIVDRAGGIGYYGANPGMFDWMKDLGHSVRAAVESLGGTAPRFAVQANYDTVRFGASGEYEGAVTDPTTGATKIFTRTDGKGEVFGVRLAREVIAVAEGVDAIYKSVAENSVAATMKDFAADLDFAKSLKDSVAAIGDLGQALEAVTAKAKAASVSMVDSFGETFARADNLGIGDTASAAIAQQLRIWMGSQGPQEAPSQVQTWLAQIQGAFAGIGEAGAKYGIAQAEIGAANDNAVQKVRDQFMDSIAAILDQPGAALRAFDKSADRMRKDATDLGVDLVAVEKAIAKQRQEVADQALGGLSTSIRQFLDGQAFDANSTLSPAARLAEAQRQFESNLSGARAGDVYASQRLVGSANTLLGEGRGYYGSTADYAALETWTRASLQNFGSQQGWDGFAPAIQSQTQTLVNAQSLAAQAIVTELQKLRAATAQLQNDLYRLMMKAA